MVGFQLHRTGLWIRPFLFQIGWANRSRFRLDRTEVTGSNLYAVVNLAQKLRDGLETKLFVRSAPALRTFIFHGERFWEEKG